jgi:hypothetical protein
MRQPSKYSADFLIDIANSAEIPMRNTNPWQWWPYPAKDGWIVSVYFDADEFDHIGYFVTPCGGLVDFWDWEDGPEKARMASWPQHEL